MKKLRLVIAAVFGSTLFISGLSLLLPSPKDATVLKDYSSVATSVVLVDVMLAWGSAIFFLLALRRFRPELKRAYRLLALSTLAVGLGLLVFPYIEYYGLWDNVWLNMSSYLQYLVGAPLMYAGVRMFYKKMELKGWQSSIVVAILGILVCSAIHPFLPYDNSWPLARWQYDLFKVVAIIPFVLYAAAGLMALRIRRQTGREYRQAFTWLVIAMAFYVVNTLGIILIEVIGYDHAYYSDRIYTAPAILGDLCLVLAGYAFAAIGVPRNTRKQSEVTSVDIIVHTAGMASNQALIDAYLDNLRIITANRTPGKPLTDGDEVTLQKTYLDIENFLVNSDPLRKFTRESIRLSVALYFGLDEKSTDTFWPSLPRA